MTQDPRAAGAAVAAEKAQRKRERWKDRATIFSSLLAAGALAFTAWQFYLGRLALQSQTVLAATNNAVQLQTEMLKNPNLYASLLETTPQELEENTAIRQVIAFYVARYYEHEAQILPSDAWTEIVSEICTLERLKKFAPVLQLKAQYPSGFNDIVSSCN